MIRCERKLHEMELQRRRVRYGRTSLNQGAIMLTTILIVILILALLGALPTWGHSRNWGYGPGGGIGLILIIVIVLVLAGRI
jgi:hypothetical protein